MHYCWPIPPPLQLQVPSPTPPSHTHTPASHLLPPRLDMDTSGVILAAKDAATAAAINAQFSSKAVSKAYLALCLGVPEQQAFTVDGAIGQHPEVKVARRVTADPEGLPAKTYVQVCGQVLYIS